MNLVRRLTTALRTLETGLLVTAVALMVSVAAWQVLARNLFGGGILWGDSFVRALVLWVAFVGAMVASRSDNHINIDILTRYASDGVRKQMKRFANLFTAAVLLLFSWYSLQFVLLDYEDGIMAFSGVPAWAVEAIMPFGALVMALRYLLHVVDPP